MENRQIYVSNLPNKVRESDLSDVFAMYGMIRYIDLKREHNTAPYAIIEYETVGEADHAAVGCDGYECWRLFGGVEARASANQRIRVIRCQPERSAA